MSLQPSSEESTWIKPKELEHVVFNAPTKEELGKIENTNFYLKVGSFMQEGLERTQLAIFCKNLEIPGAAAQLPDSRLQAQRGKQK